MWKKLMIVRFAGLLKSTRTESEFLGGKEKLKLIVGLGNPGRVYSDSRHNFGFRCINLFARELGIEFSKQRSKSRIGLGEMAGHKIILAKPQTYMNLSGESVGPLVRYYQIDLSDLLVIYDDVDLPLGTIRIREKGGAAGHNGMKSIIQNTGSQNFPRIRIGISPPAQDENVSNRNPDFVLGKFTPDEKRIVEEVCPRVAEAIGYILTEGIASAMTKYNAG